MGPMRPAGSAPSCCTRISWIENMTYRRGGTATYRGQGPDYAHRTTDPDGVDRLDERSRAADFDDMLNASSKGHAVSTSVERVKEGRTYETQHLFVPFRGLIVVDEMDCAELGGDPELLIGRGRRDDYSARGDGDLQGEATEYSV